MVHYLKMQNNNAIAIGVYPRNCIEKDTGIIDCTTIEIIFRSFADRVESMYDSIMARSLSLTYWQKGR